MGNILLVEDNPDAVALIRRAVEELSAQHQIASFSKSAEALIYAQSHPVDLFILDIQLLDYRGTVLAKQLRALPEYQFTPILFTTELAGEELSAYREIKCYDFIVKPFSEAAFQEAFQAAMAMGAQIKRAPAVLRIEQKQFLFEYDLDRILFIESFGKRVVIHSITSNGDEVADTISSYSLSKLLEMAGEKQLIQCHKSYLVNPERICRFDKAARLLSITGCEAAVPVGEKYQRNLMERGV